MYKFMDYLNLIYKKYIQKDLKDKLFSHKLDPI
jgi:hypothetical protein